MTLDKEALAKNRFWIILGIFVPLWLIVVIMLGTSVAGTITEAAKARRCRVASRWVTEGEK